LCDELARDGDSDDACDGFGDVAVDADHLLLLQH
jgi:hypothetical protein